MFVRTLLLAVLLTTAAAGTAGSQPAAAPDRARGGASGREAHVAYLIPASNVPYSLATSITLARLDGSARRRVTPPLASGSGLADPVWSPDGSRLAFVSYRDRQGALLVVNRDGSGLRRLLVVRSPAGSTPWLPDAPAWSPDGTRLAFAYGSLYVVDANSGNRRLLAASASGPRWSTNGKNLLYLPERKAHSPVAQTIFRIAADGTQRRRLAEGVIADAAWSPDGRRIAYSGACRNIISSDWECRRVFAMRADGSGKRVLTGARAIFTLGLAWISGGSELLSWNGNAGPMATNVASGRSRDLKLRAALQLAGVSADGERIAYEGDGRRLEVASVRGRVLAQARWKLPRYWLLDTEGAGSWDTQVAVFLP